MRLFLFLKLIMIVNLSKKWVELKRGFYLNTSNPNKDFGQNFDEKLVLGIEKLELALMDFGIIQEDLDGATVLTDRFNTVPIYFSSINNELVLSDNIVSICKLKAFEFDFDSVIQKIQFDFTFTPFRTLYKGVYKVPAGTSVKISLDGSFKIISQLINRIPTGDFIYSKSSFVEKTLEIKQRILDYISPLDSYYIPISGGLDSRIVLGIVARDAHADIYSRTYGDKCSLDVHNGSRVAKKAKIKHDVVQKNDAISLAEFKQTVIETGGELNGVHGHDIAGREIFEAGPWRAKITGFIGDLLARGKNLSENLRDKNEVMYKIIKVRTNFHSYDYATLLNTSIIKSNDIICDIINEYVESVSAAYGNFESLVWDYYVSKRVGCMTSLLEYATHVTKPNYKPFVIPEIVNFIASNAGYDQWEGMGYAKFAQILIPDIMDIPLSSNSIFTSKQSMFKYKVEKRFSQKKNHLISNLTHGRIIPLAHNATLNWGAVLRRNPIWVNNYLKIASITFNLNTKYLQEIYLDHCIGKNAHEEFLLRIICLGIISDGR